MPAELQDSLHQLLIIVVNVVLIAAGYYGRKLMLSLEAKAVAEGASLAAKTKLVDEQTANGILRGLVLAADNKLMASLLKTGEAKEEWVLAEANKRGLKVSMAEVKAAYELLKREVAVAGGVA